MDAFAAHRDADSELTVVLPYTKGSKERREGGERPKP